MNKTTEALKLAEEAFNYRCTPMSNYSVQTSIDKEQKALAAIREVLAQPMKQEPVAWHEPNAYGNVTTHKKWAEENGWLPLYTKE